MPSLTHAAVCMNIIKSPRRRRRRQVTSPWVPVEARRPLMGERERERGRPKKANEEKDGAPDVINVAEC